MVGVETEGGVAQEGEEGEALEERGAVVEAPRSSCNPIDCLESLSLEVLKTHWSLRILCLGNQSTTKNASVCK